MAEHWNDNPRPFVWTKTAEDIIAKVSRGRATLHQLKSAVQHYAGQPCRTSRHQSSVHS